MHKTFLLFSAALFLAPSLHAQSKTDKADVTWGAEEDIKKDGTFEYVIDDDGDAVYQLVSRKHDMFVQRMDLGLQVTYQKQINLELDKKDLAIEKILVTQDNIVVFASIYDKKLDENQLYTETFAKSDFSPEQRLTKIARIPAEKAKQSGSYEVEVSPDKSKLLVYMAKPNDKEDNKTFEIQVFDSDMKPIWSKEITMPYPSDEFSVGQVEIDNDGSIVALGKKYAEKHEAKELKRAGKATYEHHLLVLTKDDQELQDYPITVADKFLQDMTLKMGTTGNIICGGLFSNKGNWSIRGTFFLSLDRQTKQIVHESYKEFSDNFITQYMTEKEAKKASKKADKKGEDMELPDYDLHEIILREDGGAVLVAEQYSTYVTCYTDTKGNMTCVQHFLYNDILVVKVDPNGNIEWASKIPKRQHSISTSGMAYSRTSHLGLEGNITVPGATYRHSAYDVPNYSSYALEVKGDKIYFIFNDSGKNLYLSPGDKVNQFELKGKDALVVLASVDNEGNVTREALFSPEKRDVVLRPTDCVELSNDDMMIYASRKKEFRFGEIEFK